ncbi:MULTISPECIES: DNA primase [unclassified Gemella]|uniref:DNA primase n=1 Tax=unclassified Gemella TaxID=2624949 RepID=UPI0015D09983|nr:MULTISPECIES: DNA primase [unclassified Gemella]MBF0709675.1 DNA primase [Gemella sp. GL1.1]NYS27019.1 DNA primase [Gemella sp. GL1]
MARIDIDYVLENTDIVSLVSEYVKLEARGKNYIGLCPFHNEKTPSFSVSPEKKIAHCFGCGQGGNAINFLAQLESISFKQALIKLATRLGLEVEEERKTKAYNLDNRIDTMYYSSDLIADYYNYILLNTKEAEKALNYLLNRGITKESIKHFNIGYAPNVDKLIVDFLKSKNISLEYAADAGLVTMASNGSYYDVFKDRIIFPIKDDKSRVVAFSGRTMSEDKSVAKYYNTQETDIFEKRNILYNFSDARPFISKENNIILVEGYMDVIRAYQENVKNVVAIMGTSLDENRASSLLRLVDNVSLALDNDKAGQDACINIGNSLLSKTNNIYKINITSKKDIDEFVAYRKEKDENFSFSDYVINNKTHYIDWKISYLKDHSKNIEAKLNNKNEILKNIAYLKEESLKDLLLSSLANNFEIDKKILVRELAALGITRDTISVNDYVPNKTKIEKLFRSQNYDINTCRMFKYFLKSRDIFFEFYEELENMNFSNLLFSKLVKNLGIYYNNYMDFEMYKFTSNVVDYELLHLLNYIDNTDFLIEEEPSIDSVKEYIEYFKKKNNLKQEFTRLKTELDNAIGEEDIHAKISILDKLKNYKK